MTGSLYTSKCEQFEVHFPDFTYDFYNFNCKERDNEDECDEKPWISKVKQNPIRYKSFDGIYKNIRKEGGGVEMVNRRPIYRQYLDDYESDETALVGEISYCESINTWVFRIEGMGKGVNANDCSWLMKARSDVSDPAHTLDLVEESDWEVWTGVIREAAVDITCVDCNPKERTGYECNFNGKCNPEEECECKMHWMGPRCDRYSSCITAKLTGSLLSGKVTDYMVRLDRGDKKDPVNVYGRPVYYHGVLEDNNTYTVSDPLIVLAYNGYHYWIREFNATKELGTEEALISYFESFHSTWDTLNDTKLLYYSKTIPQEFSLEPKVAWYPESGKHPESGKQELEWGGEKDIVFKCLTYVPVNETIAFDVGMRDGDCDGFRKQELCGDMITVD